MFMDATLEPQDDSVLTSVDNELELGHIRLDLRKGVGDDLYWKVYSNQVPIGYLEREHIRSAFLSQES